MTRGLQHIHSKQHRRINTQGVRGSMALYYLADYLPGPWSNHHIMLKQSVV